MKLFGRKPKVPIRVSLNVRAFVEGHMVRLSLDARASEGDSLKDLLKQLSRDGTVDAAAIRHILRRTAGLTVLKNGERLAMPEAASAGLADGDELSILTPMAGG